VRDGQVRRACITGGDGICITFLFWTWCGGEGDSSGTATATFAAEATGILAGSGNNRIINDGTISVTSASHPS